MIVTDLQIEGLPQVAGTLRQAGERDLAAASISFFLTGYHLAGTQQDALPGALRAADNVAGTVDSIGNVDIHMAAGAEHGCIARGHATVGVGSGIVLTQIGLHLGESDGHSIVGEDAAQKLRGDDICGLEEINGHALPIYKGKMIAELDVPFLPRGIPMISVAVLHRHGQLEPGHHTGWSTNGAVRGCGSENDHRVLNRIVSAGVPGGR